MTRAGAGVRRISDGRETALVAGIALPLPIRDRNRGNIAAAGSDSLAAEAALAQVRLNASRAQHDARADELTRAMDVRSGD